MTGGSEDPSEPEQTARVRRIMFAGEFPREARRRRLDKDEIERLSQG